jgi:preprotein translocase subunit SecF
MTAISVSPPRGIAAMRSLPHRLYTGEVNYDFLSRRRRWYGFSALLLVISIAAILLRGFNYSIDFKGGSTYELPTHGHTVSQASAAVSSAGVTDATVQKLGDGNFFITTKKATDQGQVDKIVAALAKDIGVNPNQISPSTIGATWGGQISDKAIKSLIIFLIVVVIYITAAFREWKMAASAFVALLHDLLVTAGIYALVGFEVSPSTVIAVLTILGFSLYDTVVVFDKVRENTARLQAAARATYSEQANLALNQTLLRSINTSLIALLPVAALLFVGAGLLGAGTLKDLALAQLVGLASGAYSSIFIATPLLAQLKEREEPLKALTAKITRARAAGKPAVGIGRRPATGSVVEAVASDGDAGGAAVVEIPATGVGRRPGAVTKPPARKGKAGRPHGKRRR